MPNLDTDCSEVLEAQSLQPASAKEDIQQLERLALEAFDVGKLVTQGSFPKIRFNNNLGAQDKKYSFVAYSVANLRTGEKSNLIAAIVARCENQPLRTVPVQIEYIKIMNPEIGAIYELNFEDFRLPEHVMRLHSKPYFFSVNNYDQYLDVMDRIGEIFGNRSLAGYFLSEFNRSLQSRDRNNEALTNYSYRRLDYSRR